MSFRYLSVCSGIEAATQAWHPLGWQCAGVSEIEPFPRAVLEHRLGAVPVEFDEHRWTEGSNTIPLFGDFTKIEAHHVGPIDLLVGGTPCQSFSVAGKRLGLDDPRGNLTLEFLALARRLRPRYLLWENVPGVLSHDEGRTFGTFLGLLGECGFERWAYRVLDAQHVRTCRFGRAVPQRRRRVFVVGYSGTADIHPRAVLFDRESLRGNPAPRREAGQGSAPTLAARTRGGGGLGTDFDCDGGLIVDRVDSGVVSTNRMVAFGEYEDDGTASAMKARNYKDATDLVAHSLRAEGFDASEDGTGRGTPLVATHHPIAIQERAVSDNPDAGPDGKGWRDDGAAYTLEARQVTQALAFDMRGREGGAMPEGPHDTANIRAASGGSSRSYVAEMLDRNLAGAYGDSHASTPETDAYSKLLKLREAVGEEAFAEWGFGISHSLQQADVLRPAMYGEGVRGQAKNGHELVGHTQAGAQDLPEGAVQALWSAGCAGRSPQGWQPSEQLARELGAHLSKLSHQGAPRGAFLRDLWRAAQGLGVLREALPADEAPRRPEGRQGQPAHAAWGVRRLTPKECERLQGFPDGFTAIPWRGKLPENCPDGPRYKALGNSFAVNVITWIGERIAAVEKLA